MSNPQNSCHHIGRLVHTPELHETASGKAVASFTLAVDRSYTKNGERPVDFIDFVVWNNLAKSICEHHKQGDLLAVDGELQLRIYEDKKGKKHTIAEIKVDSCHKLVTALKNRTPADQINHETPPPPTDEDYQDVDEGEI